MRRTIGLLLLLGLLGSAGVRPATTQPYEPALEALLAHRSLRDASVAVIVTDLFAGEEVLVHRPDEPLIPASNMKVVTAALALEYLGADATFYTRLRLGGPIRAGVLEGDLVLEGNGDPDFGAPGTEDGPESWVGKLAGLGVQRVAGNLVLVERVLDREYFHPDWAEYPAAGLYTRGPAALGCRENTVTVFVRPAGRIGRPGRLSVEPDCGHVQLVNRTETVSGRSRPIWFRREWGSGRMDVHAEVRHGGRRVGAAAAVQDPPLFLGRCFRMELRRAGIALDGRIVRYAGDRPPEGKVVAEHRTPLPVLLRAGLKSSDNRIAEILRKSAGAASSGEEGSFATGARAATEILRRAGAGAEGAECRDGSGLSRRNRLTVRQLARLLAWVSDRPYASMFSDALPSGGESGTTLRSRFTDAPMNACVRAKTGYLDGVRALSGFLRVAPDRVLVFSVLINGKTGPVRAAVKPLDEFVQSVWRIGLRRSRRPGR